MILFVRCTATDPTDNTHFTNKEKMGKSKGLQKLNYGHVVAQIVAMYFRRLERKILRSVIRRRYLDPVNTSAFIESLLPFSLVTKDDTVLLDLNEEDITFCSVCNHEVGLILVSFGISLLELCDGLIPSHLISDVYLLQVKKHSKHCRT